MSITTGDQVTAGLDAQQLLNWLKNPAGTIAAGEAYTLWNAAGVPSAGSLPGAVALGGSGATAYPVASDTGAINWTNPTGGRSSYAGQATARMSQAGTLILYDRVWHGAFVSTGAGTCTFTAPASGSLRLPSGSGAELWVEALGVATTGQTVNFTYTNQGGTASRTTGAITMPNTGGRNNVMSRMTLQAGDTGVRSVQSVAVGGATGAASLGVVLARRIATFSFPQANAEDVQDFFRLGMRKIQDSAAIAAMFIPAGTTLPVITAEMAIIQG